MPFFRGESTNGEMQCFFALNNIEVENSSLLEAQRGTHIRIPHEEGQVDQLSCCCRQRIPKMSLRLNPIRGERLVRTF